MPSHAVAYTCLPGWCIVERAETEETYAGSSLIIPDYVRARVAKDQYEIVAVADQGESCDEADCDLFHVKRHHAIPAGIEPGAWVILGPRSLVGIPGETTRWLTPMSAIWCRLG